MYRLTICYDAPADPTAFDEQYFGHHVALVRPIPGLVDASFSKPQPLDTGTAPYLVAQLDFADADSFEAAMKSPEMGVVAHDAQTLPATPVMFSGVVTGA